MKMAGRYIPGDYYLICARTGWKIRRSDARVEWDGTVVHKSQYEERHPLDAPRRARPERVPPVVRPEPTDVFLDVGDVTESDL
jgi:hypothetical protein